MKHKMLAGALFAGLMMLAARPLHGQIERVPVLRITTEIEIGVPPAQVWSHLTSGKSLVSWCPYWTNPDNARVTLTRVGDVLEFADEWGNTGKSVVAFLEKNREIRIFHEPANGSYLCQSRMRLEPAGKGTRVVYVEQYTDSSAPKDAEATANSMQQSMKATLLKLKKSAEA